MAHVRTLADFPPEVLASITAPLKKAVLKLWKTGNAQLMHKLCHGGCTVIDLEGGLMYSQTVWPDMIYKLRALCHLQVYSYNSLPIHVDLSRLAPTLRNLSLHNVDLNKTLPDENTGQVVDIGRCLPNLTTLVLSRIIDFDNNDLLPNYLPTLPPTITSLRTTAIRGLSANDDLARALPRSLTSFELRDARNASVNTASYELLPPSLTRFACGLQTEYLKTDILPRVVHHLPFLTSLGISLGDTSAHHPSEFVLPSQLRKLYVYSHPLSADFTRALWRALPPTLTDLAIAHDEDHVMTPFAPNEWVSQLPRALTRLKLNLLPITHPDVLPNDGNKAIAATIPAVAWPPNLRTLSVHWLEQSNVSWLHQVGLPPRLQTCEFPQPWEDYVQLILPPGFTFPSTLTTLNTRVFGPNVQLPPACHTAKVPHIDYEWLVGPMVNPDTASVKNLTLDVRPGPEFYTRIRALPPTLESLAIYVNATKISLNVVMDVSVLLPLRHLRSLELGHWVRVHCDDSFRECAALQRFDATLYVNKLYNIGGIEHERDDVAQQVSGFVRDNLPPNLTSLELAVNFSLSGLRRDYVHGVHLPALELASRTTLTRFALRNVRVTLEQLDAALILRQLEFLSVQLLKVPLEAAHAFLRPKCPRLRACTIDTSPVTVIPLFPE